MIVCICHHVSEQKIRQAVDAGMTSMVQLRDHLLVGKGCGKCHPHAKQVLHACTAGPSKLCSQARPLRSQGNAVAA
jgi:bacterioferritin-associated ferredoxin